ncbi:MAG: chromate transporter [Caldisericia bacterium]|jgi:chromate transporter|nr:chromate transporter [Caldisericia bacterium]
MRFKLLLFFTFLKISALTLGGGYAMVPIIEREIIKKNIIDKEEFLKLFSKAQSAPGPIAVNTAFMIGMKLGGILLGFYYVLGVFIPPFFAILIVASLFKKYINLFYIQYFLEGIRVGIAVILINFFLGIIKNFKIYEFVFLLFGFLLIYFLKLHSIYTLVSITFLYFIFISIRVKK